MNLENDDLFDDFIRQKLNQIQPKFDEKAWLDLESRLPQPNAKRRFLNLGTRLGAIAALLIGAGVFYYATSTQSSEVISKVEKVNTHSLFEIQEKEENTSPKSTQHKHLSHSQKEESSLNAAYDNTLHSKENTLDTNAENIYLADNSISESENTSSNPYIYLQEELEGTKKISKSEIVMGLGKEDSKTTEDRPVGSLTSISSIQEHLIPVVLTPMKEPHTLSFNRKIFRKNPSWQVGLGSSAEVTLAPHYSTRRSDWYGAISVHAEKMFGNKFRLGIGLNYYQKFQKIDKNFNQSIATQTFSLNENMRINQLTIEKERGTELERLEIPIELKFLSNKNSRLRAFIASGVSVGLNLRQKQIYESENIFIDANSGELLGSNNSFKATNSTLGFNVSWHINAGLEYSLNSRIHIQAMPYFKYALNDTQIKSEQNQTYGLRTILFYRW